MLPFGSHQAPLYRGSRQPTKGYPQTGSTADPFHGRARYPNVLGLQGYLAYELGPSPRSPPPTSDEEWRSRAAPMVGFAWLGRLLPAADPAATSPSSTDPPEAGPRSSGQRTQPLRGAAADERPVPSSAAPQRLLPLSARAAAPLLGIVGDRRDLKWAWKPPPSPCCSCRIPEPTRTLT